MAMSKLPGDSEEGADGVFADINITPLTDIFLVLLIIFMVTSSAIVESQSGTAGVKVNLPKGGATDVQTTQQDLAVAVLVDGRIIIGGKVMTQDELKAAFESAHGKNPDMTVIVQADAGVPHGKVVDVMELAKGAGLAHLAIATRAQ
ncbi:MAG: biopolymer transporter ExbD [Deltaproteobacteria bacterium]|nr:biopolymer transporter ExbD [Deltaproteobacteria bacterium]